MRNSENTGRSFTHDESLSESDNRPWWNSSEMWGRGIIKDFKQTVGSYWVMEMTNLNQKTIAVSFFLFFAAITPAITFGGVYQRSTANRMGAVELILATAWTGVYFALFAGQPIILNGGTGPMLTIQTVLFKFSDTIGVNFLTFNAWVGIWVVIYMVVGAFVDSNRVINYATRFTDEIFAMMIALIFIIDALGKPTGGWVGVFHYFNPDHPSHEKYVANPEYSITAVGLLSVILTLGTAGLAFLLRNVKQSPYLCNQFVRSLITDFGVFISVVVWCLLDNLAFENTPTERLNVPNTFAPTMICCTSTCDALFPTECPDVAEPWGRRPWMVNLFNVGGKSWVPIAAAGPAFLAFVMVCLDNGVTWHLLYHPSHKLKHGPAYNYDTIIMGVSLCVNSLLGLPWVVGSTTPSVNHLHALSEKTSSGKIDSVQETRLTGLFIHSLVTASIFALPLLRLVPIPVLYGVFLFMGIVSLGTNQFYHRCEMLFMQPSKYPREPYTEEVAPKRMHMFTVIQLFMLVLMWIVKDIKVITIVFPLVIVSCVPIRLYILPRMFKEDELIFLDSDEDMIAAIRQIRGSAAPTDFANDDKFWNEIDEEIAKVQSAR